MSWWPGLRSLLPAPPGSAPLAIGAAPEEDPYLIPSMMAGTVLAEAGLRDINFGANTPLHLLASEAVRMGAKLVWVSISSVADAKARAVEAVKALDKTAVKTPDKPSTTEPTPPRFEFGAADDFQLTQALNHLKGQPVVASAKAVAQVKPE